jgi:hypothetical protein
MSASVWRADSATWTQGWEVVSPRRAIVRVTRAAVLCSLLLLIFIAEYSQGTGGTTSKSFLYSPLAGGFRVIDVAVLVLALAHGFALGCRRERGSRFPRKLGLLMAGFGIAIGISLVYGFERGGQNLFFDWRAMALGVAFYVIYRFWIQDPADVRSAVFLFGTVAAAHIAILFLAYAQGRGSSLLGLRVPLFDGPSLSALVFVSILGLALSASTFASRRGAPWLLLSAGAMLLVALCFRRSYWAELAVGVALLALISRASRLRILALPLCIAGIAFLVLGSSLTARLSSLDFTRGDVPYGEDNADHVGDVLDAWAQVRAAPLMGIGLGRSYPTWHIRNWKEESVMVHNAPLHVWLKYGLLGLGLYFVYHLYLFRCLRGQARRASPGNHAVASAVLAYLAAQFIVSLGFTPWPYSAVQSTNLIAFLLAVAFVREPLCPYQAFPSSPQALTAPLTWKTQFSA